MGIHLKNDYTGKICGCWKVIERDMHPKSKSHETFWIAECQNCGNIASVRKTDLDREPSSCNNCKGDFSAIKNIKKYNIQPGDQFGYLTVLEKPHTAQKLDIVEEKGLGDRGKKTEYVKCLCQCGNVVYVRKKHLLGIADHSRTISCGCAKKSSGEIKIEKILIENNINFQTQYRIKDFNLSAPFDFAIFDDDNKLIKLIEFDGEQHFESVDYFGGEEKLLLQQERDMKKNQWCEEHHIKLQRIPYYDYDKISVEYLLS